VFIYYSNNGEAMARAIQEIDGLSGSSSPAVAAKRTPDRDRQAAPPAASPGIKDFGCFVEMPPGQGRPLPASAGSSPTRRVRRTDDVVKIGDDGLGEVHRHQQKSGKVRLSRKAAMKEMEAQKQAEGAVASPATTGTP
jgi:polyribonucleotide nucleotidyltransferase